MGEILEKSKGFGGMVVFIRILNGGGGDSPQSSPRFPNLPGRNPISFCGERCSRWWQLKHFLDSSSQKFGELFIQFDD